MKALAPYVLTIDHDHSVVVCHVAMNAAERKEAVRDPVVFIDKAMDAGYVTPYGCRCSHCQNDWDCCGRMVPGYITMRPVRGGVKLSQSFNRNV